MSPSPERTAAAALRLIQVVGARPQFVKLAPVCRAIDAARNQGAAIESLIVHTGQHYDTSMSDVFFDELDIPRADVDLGIGSGSHGRQTGRMLEKLEETFVERRPDLVLTYGDTNSTLAATLAGGEAARSGRPHRSGPAQLQPADAGGSESPRRRPPFRPAVRADAGIHAQPLERRPRQTAHSWSATSCWTQSAPSRRSRCERSRVLERLGLAKRGYLVATLHRAENTDASRLGGLLATLGSVGTPGRPVILPLHPRTAHVIREAGLALPDGDCVRVVEPLGYLDMIALVSGARIVLTDSGGLQKEAFFLGRPCVTLRGETEWVETVTSGGNVVAGTDPRRIREAVASWDARLAGGEPDFAAGLQQAFGDGAASAKIVTRALEFLRERKHA